MLLNFFLFSQIQIHPPVRDHGLHFMEEVFIVLEYILKLCNNITHFGILHLIFLTNLARNLLIMVSNITLRVLGDIYTYTYLHIHPYVCVYIYIKSIYKVLLNGK